MADITDWIKQWWIPLLRAFVVGFLLAVIGGLAKVTNVPALWTLICGAAVAGLNAAVILVQQIAPVIPNPKPPTP